MTGYAGKNTRIFISAPSVPLTAHSVRRQSGGPQNIYQIDDDTRQVLDTSQQLTISVSGSPVYREDDFGVPSPSNTEDWSIDPLFGILTRNETGPHPAASNVTIAGNYHPLNEVGQARSYSMSRSVNLLDSTTFNNQDFTEREQGIKDLSINLSELDGANVQDWHNFIDNDTRILIEIRQIGGGAFTIYGTGTAKSIKMWCLVETVTTSADNQDLLVRDVDLMIDAINNSYPYSARSK